MVKIYHVAGTRGLRAIWTCEELAIPDKMQLTVFGVNTSCRDCVCFSLLDDAKDTCEEWFVPHKPDEVRG